MKKMKLFKILMTLVLALAFSGAFAQLASYNDFNDDVTGDLPDQVTIETTMPFWVFPDAYYNPDFDPTGYGTTALLHAYIEGQTDIVSTFAWSIAEVPGYDLTAQTGNYVEIAFTAANGFVLGVNTITVAETAGACPGSDVTFPVTVVAQPTMTIGTPAADIDACEGVGALTTAVSATLTGAADDMFLQWDYKAYTVLATWDGVTYPIPGGDIDDADISAVVGYTATDYPLTTAPLETAAIGANQLVASKAWTSYNNKITVYEFELIGTNDKISRKSDYLTIYNAADDGADPEDYTYYTNGAMSRYIVVRPAPSTGPIYHIPNTWGL